MYKKQAFNVVHRCMKEDPLHAPVHNVWINTLTLAKLPSVSLVNALTLVLCILILEMYSL